MPVPSNAKERMLFPRKQPVESLHHSLGFTLLEILLAMFIFTIVSMIIVGALHSVFTTQTAVESRAKRLAELQIAFIHISRDLEQTINRPITTSNGGLENTFIGTPNSMTFTHTGILNPGGTMQRSSLQRVYYHLSEHNLIRATWPQLDLTPEAHSQQRVLLRDVDTIALEYLDHKGGSFTRWPSPKDQGNMGSLPKAVKLVVTLSDLGTISQLIIIPGQPIEKTN